MGGMVEAIEQGFPQREIAEASYQFQQAVERREKVIVGVNDFVQDDEPPMPILYIDESTADDAAGAARASCGDPRQRRGAALARRAAGDRARHAATRWTPLLDCVRAYATVGEMCDALRDVWGEYEEVPII